MLSARHAENLPQKLQLLKTVNVFATWCSYVLLNFDQNVQLVERRWSVWTTPQSLIMYRCIAWILTPAAEQHVTKSFNFQFQSSLIEITLFQSLRKWMCGLGVESFISLAWAIPGQNLGEYRHCAMLWQLVQRPTTYWFHYFYHPVYDLDTCGLRTRQFLELLCFRLGTMNEF